MAQTRHDGGPEPGVEVGDCVHHRVLLSPMGRLEIFARGLVVPPLPQTPLDAQSDEAAVVTEDLRFEVEEVNPGLAA